MTDEDKEEILEKAKRMSLDQRELALIFLEFLQSVHTDETTLQRIETAIKGLK